MNNTNWLTTPLTTIVTLFLLPLNVIGAQYGTTYQMAEPPAVNTQTQGQVLPWWNERTMLTTDTQLYPQEEQNHTQAVNQQHFQGHKNIQVLPANYQKKSVRILRQALNCQNANAFNLPDRCIKRSGHNRRGLEEQIKYLSARNPTRYVGGKWATVSNATLLHTARELLNWDNGFGRHSLLEKFFLREVSSVKHPNSAEYTGYFTPLLQVQDYPDQQYRFPIYRPPPTGTHLTRREIDQGGLTNRGLEIAWTNDPINLFFAHVQGSAVVRYPNGYERYLGYAAHNNHNYVRIRPFLRDSGYMRGSLSNENIRRWLHANPHRIEEVLHLNPRYIFFGLSDHSPKTATGATVLPGHTLAVDDDYIPLGAVLLAEVPRIDHLGKRVGSDWRLLFAQDRGNDINGPGRFDMYTGLGKFAEVATYQITGLHRTYMLIHKQSRAINSVAGM